MKIFTVIFDGREATPEQVAAAALERARNITREAWIKKKKSEPPQDLPAVGGSWGLSFGPRHPSGMQAVRAVILEEPGGEPLLTDENLARELSRVLKTPFLYLSYTDSTEKGLWAIAFENGEVVGEKTGNYNTSLKSFFGPRFGITRRIMRIIEDWLVEEQNHSPFGPDGWERLLSAHKDHNDAISRTLMLGAQLFIENSSLTEAGMQARCEERFGKVTQPELFSFAYRQVRAAYKTQLPQENPSRFFALTAGSIFSKGEGILLTEPKELTPREYFAVLERAKADLEARKTEKFGPRVRLGLTEEEKTSLSYEEQKRELYRRWQQAVRRMDIARHQHGLATFGFGVRAPVRRGDYVAWEKGFARVRQVVLRPDEERETFAEEARVITRQHEDGETAGFYTSFSLSPAADLKPVAEADVPENWRVPERML